MAGIVPGSQIGKDRFAVLQMSFTSARQEPQSVQARVFRATARKFPPSSSATRSRVRSLTPWQTHTIKRTSKSYSGELIDNDSQCQGVGVCELNPLAKNGSL